MTNKNMNDVAQTMVETVENAMPEAVQEAINETVTSNHSGLTAFLVGGGTAAGGYLLGKFVIEPIAKKVKTGISNWWNSRKKTNEKAAETEAEKDNNVVAIPEDIETTHKIG